MPQSDAPTASLPKRLAAIFYELLLLAAVLFVADYLFITLTRNVHAEWLQRALQAWLFMVMGVYFSWMWLHGQSLAMKTWRIRLQRSDGGRLLPLQAALRFIVALALPGISQLWALFDADHQFLHDRIAGTRLVQAR